MCAQIQCVHSCCSFVVVCVCNRPLCRGSMIYDLCNGFHRGLIKPQNSPLLPFFFVSLSLCFSSALLSFCSFYLLVLISISPHLSPSISLSLGSFFLIKLLSITCLLHVSRIHIILLCCLQQWCNLCCIAWSFPQDKVRPLRLMQVCLSLN